MEWFKSYHEPEAPPPPELPPERREELEDLELEERELVELELDEELYLLEVIGDSSNQC